MNEAPWNTIVDHCLGTLPADVDTRRRLLSSLVSLIPAGSPKHRELAVCLGHLDIYLIAQRELSLGLQERGSGRLGDTPMERSAAVKGGRR